MMQNIEHVSPFGEVAYKNIVAHFLTHSGQMVGFCSTLYTMLHILYFLYIWQHH